MNKFMGVGSLPRNAVVNGDEKKVLKFTLTTCLGKNRKTQKTMWAFVPCVVFAASEELVSVLTENGKGTILELEGKVSTSKFESQGVTRYSTDVVVDQRSIRVLGKDPEQAALDRAIKGE